MPLLKFSSVLSFTSEDPNHPADNLLSLHTYRKWKIAESEHGKPASVTLKLEKLSTITSLDIGNDGSAFVEVLVARDDDNFQVLLPTSSFMSPLEARNGTDTNRVRMFTSRHLNKNTAAQKWTRVKCVCTQPFNKHSSFGLTFVALTSDDDSSNQKDDEAKNAKAGQPKPDFARDEPTPASSNISIGAFFAKRRKLDSPQNEDKQSPEGNKRSADTSAEVASSSRAASAAEASDAGAARSSAPKYKAKKETRPVDSTASAQPSAKLAALSPRAASPAVRSPFNGSCKPSSTALKQATPRLRDSSVPASEAESAGRETRPTAMQGIVYTMSGYQNPKRSQLRDKMTAMGASYRPDWTSDCTHLICAFANTPKFRAVQGKGRIVSHRWIEESYLFKKKMPWKKYALEKDVSGWPDSPEAPETASRADVNSRTYSDGSRPEKKQVEEKESEDEKEVSQQKDEEQSWNYEDETDNEDTDDEIQRCLNPRAREADGECGAQLGSQSSSSPSAPKERTCRDDCNSAGDEAAPSDAYLTDTDEDRHSPPSHQKMDVSQLKLITLPDLFRGERFFLHRSCEDSDSLQRYIIAFNGSVSDYMSNSVTFVVAEADWDQSFDEASREHKAVRFVKPSWIWRCADTSSRAALEPHVISPP